MKTTEVFFHNVNFVGREIENVQDLVKALAAGMDICTEEEEGYCRFYDKDVTDENGNVTTYVEERKTDDELFEEMKGDLDEGYILYAGFFLDCRQWSIKPAKYTTLQTDFSVGEEVYLLVDNKITKAKIEQIWLTKGKNNLHDSDRITNAICSEFYQRNSTTYYNSSTFAYICDKIDSVRAQNESFASVIIKDRPSRLVKLSDLFATKEELVKHLMEEQDNAGKP